MTITELIEKLDRLSMPEPNSGCWLWLGAVSISRLTYGSLRHGQATIRAHRASWLAHKGPIPDGLFVCHHCDNTLCINPDHLFLGSPKDNNSDRRNKRRDHWFVSPGEAARALARARAVGLEKSSFARGPDHYRFKLTPEIIAQIDSLSRSGLSQRKIAARVGVSQFSVSRTLARKPQ